MNKTRQVHVRVTPVERLALEILAERMGLKPSEALREMIRHFALQQGIWPPAEPDFDLTAAPSP